MPDIESARELLASEYDKLKSEQVQRIGFRDNLLFVHLAATGSVASWVITNIATPNTIHALLVIPWICVVLGWTYVVNDHHISRIGRYIRRVMNQRASSIVQFESIDVLEDDGRKFNVSEAFGWEPYHRIDKRRKLRKLTQFAIDEITFFMPGALALLGYAHLNNWSISGWWMRSVIIAEALCLAALFLSILAYADFSRDK